MTQHWQKAKSGTARFHGGNSILASFTSETSPLWMSWISSLCCQTSQQRLFQKRGRFTLLCKIFWWILDLWRFFLRKKSPHILLPTSTTQALAFNFDIVIFKETPNRTRTLSPSLSPSSRFPGQLVPTVYTQARSLCKVISRAKINNNRFNSSPVYFALLEVPPSQDQ